MNRREVGQATSWQNKRIIMNYEQKYKSLIAEIKERMTLISAEKEKASSQVDKLSLGGRIAILQELLAFTHKFEESENDRIRKELISFFTKRDEFTKSEPFDGLSNKQIIAWLEKQGEQKPDWSDEDERIRKCLIRDQEKALDDVRKDKYGHSEIISDLKEMYRERIDWLESLKDRVQLQSKQEWSEYDKTKLSEAIQMIEANGTWIRSEDADSKITTDGNYIFPFPIIKYQLPLTYDCKIGDKVKLIIIKEDNYAY